MCCLCALPTESGCSQNYRDVQLFFQHLSVRIKCSRNVWMQSGQSREPPCSGFPSAVFSEQEGGGTNDRPRNEVTTGPPGVGGGAGWAISRSQSRALATSSDGKLWHYLCLCEWQTERVTYEAALTRPQLCFTGQSEATVSSLNLHRIVFKKVHQSRKMYYPNTLALWHVCVSRMMRHIYVHVW